MKILDILNSPWAIQPDKLIEIRGIYATHLRGEKIDIAAVEKRLGQPLDNQPQGYDIIDGVAVLPIEGVIAKRANLFTQISGGASTQLVMRDLQSALADPAVHSIILSIDSPGGTVDGTQALADAVLAGRDIKPIVTLADGAMASAAYWIGSAASAAYIADSTTLVGSIGVVATHTDISQAEAQRGIKTTEVYAGQYKRIASQYGPLTDAGRQTIQEQVDYTYSLFVGAVAKQRGVSEETVLKDMADGRVFIGQQAIDAGLVDGVSTLQDLVQQLNQQHSGSSASRTVAAKPRAGAAQASNPPQSQGETMSITREQLAADAPDVLAAILAEGRTAGAAAERERIQAVEGQLIPGHEALINTLKFDGKSTGGDAAMAVNAAERKVRETQAQAMAGDAPPPVRQTPPATVTKPAADGDDANLPIEERAKAVWDKDAKLRAEFNNTFSTYLAYAKAHDAGTVKVLSK